MELKNFSIQWKVDCPHDDPVAKLLQQLENSATLQELLDRLIEFIQYAQVHPAPYLNKKLEECYQLVSIITDTPNITSDQLLIIKAQRRIDRHFLPKHMPGDEPKYVPVADYLQEEAVKDSEEGQKLRGKIAEKEHQLRINLMVERKQRAVEKVPLKKALKEIFDKAIAQGWKPLEGQQAAFQTLIQVNFLAETNRKAAQEFLSQIQEYAIKLSANLRLIQEYLASIQPDKSITLEFLKNLITFLEGAFKFESLSRVDYYHIRTAVEKLQHYLSRGTNAPTTLMLNNSEIGPINDTLIRLQAYWEYRSPFKLRQIKIILAALEKHKSYIPVRKDKLLRLGTAYYETETLPKNIIKQSVLEECALFLTSEPPRQETLALLPIQSCAYVVTDKQIFYVDKRINECILVISSDRTQHNHDKIYRLFNTEMKVRRLERDKPRSLSFQEMEKIRGITGHVRLNLVTKGDLKKIFQRFEDCLTLIENLQIEQELKTDLQRKLKSKLDELLKEAIEAEKNFERYASRDQMMLAPYIAQQTLLNLLHILKGYDVDLTPLKQAFMNTVGPVNPKLLAYYNLYKKAFPGYFRSEINASVQPNFNNNLKTNYLDKVGREEFRLHLYAGKCYHFKKENNNLTITPFSSQSHSSHEKEGWVSFVMNSKGEIFATTHSDSMPHSAFMGGWPVVFAGEMKLARDGTILAISNYSGHYMPTLADMLNFARHLFKRGVNLSNVDFFEVNDGVTKSKLSKLQRSKLPKHKLADLKEKIMTDSMRLKHSTRYRFQNGEFVKAFDYKKAFRIAGLIFMTVLFAALLTGTIIASQGTAVPVISLILFKLAGAVGPSVAQTLGIGVCASLTVITGAMAAKIGKAYSLFKSGLSIIRDFWSVPTNKESAVDITHENEISTPQTSGQSHQYINSLTGANPAPRKEATHQQDCLPTENQILTIAPRVEPAETMSRVDPKSYDAIESRFTESPSVPL